MAILQISGVANIRDVGGMPVGRSRVRSGALLRSAHLTKVTQQGRAQLRQLVRRVVDLRDDAEVMNEPSAFIEAPVTRVPLFMGSAGSFFVQNMDLAAMYQHMLDDSAQRLANAVKVISTGPGTLVHCTVGKDRTGVTVALALSAVGADREAVVADYALTASQIPEKRNRAVTQYLRAHMPDATNAIQLATESPASVMRDMLADVDASYGSPADYLLQAGLTMAELDALRRVLVE